MSAAVTGGVSVESLLMFALVFFWTPPHFWALALFMKEDYHNAGVPMLTVTHGRQATRRHIFVYTLVLAAFALAFAFAHERRVRAGRAAPVDARGGFACHQRPVLPEGLARAGAPLGDRGSEYAGLCAQLFAGLAS